MSAVAPATASAATPVGKSFVMISCNCGTFTHTLDIATYNSITGAISGTNTRPTGLVTGTVNESVSPATITMQWRYQNGSGWSGPSREHTPARWRATSHALVLWEEAVSQTRLAEASKTPPASEK